MTPTSEDKAVILHNYAQLRRKCDGSPYLIMNTLADLRAGLIAQALADGREALPAFVREFMAARNYADSMSERTPYWHRPQRRTS